MSDTAPVVDDAGAAADAASLPAEPESAGKWDEGTRAYIDSLKQESIKHRQEAKAAKPYAEAYGSLEANDEAVFRKLVTEYKAGNFDAVAAMATDIAAQLTPAERGDLAEAAGAAATDEPLTKAQFETLMAERETQQTEARQVERYTQQMQDEARKLGYNPDDMKSPDYTLLLQVMQADGTTDVKRGHELVEAYKQSIIDGWRDGKATEAANGRRVPAAGTGGTQPKVPKTVEEASAAMKAMVSGNRF